MEPNSWAPPPAPAGFYSHPEDPGRFRFWDGATWTQPPLSSDSGKYSALTTIRGICLIFLALLSGLIAVFAFTEVPGSRDVYATGVADMGWCIYFGAMLALCVIAWILGLRSLTRPTAHPAYSVVTGVLMMVVGLAGGALAFFFLAPGEALDTFVAYVVAGIFFAFSGAIITLLSALTLFALRRSGVRSATA